MTADFLRGLDVKDKGFIHPREAVAMIMHASGDCRETAVDALAMRLCGRMILAFAGRVAGQSVPGSDLQPSFNPQIIPACLWDSPQFCSPASPIWTIGDLSCPVHDGNIHLFNIRFVEHDVLRMTHDIKGGAFNDNVASEEEGRDPMFDYLGTGSQGRPSKGKEIYLAEFQRRLASGEKIGLLSEEARRLKAWYQTHYPQHQQPTVGTVQNAMRDAHRAHRMAQKTQP